MAKNKKGKKENNHSVSPQQKNRINQTVVKASYHSGVLPSPETLYEYNQVVPDAAERIIAMAENQSNHRQSLELSVIQSDIKSSRLGLHYGLIIGLTTIIGGVVCILMGHEIGGSILGGTSITGLVGVFVYGSRQKRKEREQKHNLSMANTAMKKSLK